MNKKNWPLAVIALLCTLIHAPALANENRSGLISIVTGLLDYEEGRGGRLAQGVSDVMVDRFDTCRWIDNTNPSGDYFVPVATQGEWEAFVAHAPNFVTRANCCRPVDVALTASNGLTEVFSLPYGREGAADDRGSRTLSKVFSFVRVVDGANVTETINQVFTCSGGSWTAGEPEVTAEVELPPTGGDTIVTVGCTPDTITLEGGSCTPLDPARNPATLPAGQRDYHNIDTGQHSATYVPGYHCLAQARNWGVEAVLSASALSVLQAGQSYKIIYDGHLPTGAREVSFSFDPNVSATLFTDGGTSGKNHYTTIRYDAAAKQFILRNESFGWGNCKDIQCGGLVMPRLTIARSEGCAPPPPPAEPVVTEVQANCNRPNGAGMGTCQWGSTRNTTVAGLNWANAAYVCARAGFPYLVAAQGYNGRGDCSGCSWALWNNARLPQRTALDDQPIPAATSWTGSNRGSWSSASELHRVWCSDAPGQRVPPHCPGGTVDFPISKVVNQTCTTKKGFKGQPATTTCTGGTTINGTVTAVLPDAYNAKPAPRGVLSSTIVHPDDTRAPAEGSSDDGRSTFFYRVGSDGKAKLDAAHTGSLDSLHKVDATLMWDDSNAENFQGSFECRADGWVFYPEGCKEEVVQSGKFGRRVTVCR